MWNETNGKAHSPVCLKLHAAWGGQQTSSVLRNLTGNSGNKIVTEGLDKHSTRLCLTRRLCSRTDKFREDPMENKSWLKNSKSELRILSSAHTQTHVRAGSFTGSGAWVQSMTNQWLTIKLCRPRGALLRTGLKKGGGERIRGENKEKKEKKKPEQTHQWGTL